MRKPNVIKVEISNLQKRISKLQKELQQSEEYYNINQKENFANLDLSKLGVKKASETGKPNPSNSPKNNKRKKKKSINHQLLYEFQRVYESEYRINFIAEGTVEINGIKKIVMGINRWFNARGQYIPDLAGFTEEELIDYYSKWFRRFLRTEKSEQSYHYKSGTVSPKSIASRIQPLLQMNSELNKECDLEFVKDIPMSELSENIANYSQHEYYDELKLCRSFWRNKLQKSKNKELYESMYSYDLLIPLITFKRKYNKSISQSDQLKLIREACENEYKINGEKNSTIRKILF